MSPFRKLSNGFRSTLSAVCIALLASVQPLREDLGEGYTRRTRSLPEGLKNPKSNASWPPANLGRHQRGKAIFQGVSRGLSHLDRAARTALGLAPGRRENIFASRIEIELNPPVGDRMKNFKFKIAAAAFLCSGIAMMA